VSIDYTYDYSDHVLLDNKSKYKELYKLYQTTAADVHKGDLVLIKTGCGCYKIFMATADTGEDNSLHLTQYSEVEFVKASDDQMDGSVVKESYTPCGC